MLGLRVLAPLLCCLAAAAAPTRASSSYSGAAQAYTSAAAGTQASSSAVPYDFDQERVALVALYNATGGEHWSDSPENGWPVPLQVVGRELPQREGVR